MTHCEVDIHFISANIRNSLIYWKHKCRRKSARASMFYISFRIGRNTHKNQQKVDCYFTKCILPHILTQTSHIVFIHSLINFILVRPPNVVEDWEALTKCRYSFYILVFLISQTAESPPGQKYAKSLLRLNQLLTG